MPNYPPTYTGANYYIAGNLLLPCLGRLTAKLVPSPYNFPTSPASGTAFWQNRGNSGGFFGAYGYYGIGAWEGTSNLQRMVQFRITTFNSLGIFDIHSNSVGTPYVAPQGNPGYYGAATSVIGARGLYTTNYKVTSPSQVSELVNCPLITFEDTPVTFSKQTYVNQINGCGLDQAQNNLMFTVFDDYGVEWPGNMFLATQYYQSGALTWSCGALQADVPVVLSGYTWLTPRVITKGGSNCVIVGYPGTQQPNFSLNAAAVNPLTGWMLATGYPNAVGSYGPFLLPTLVKIQGTNVNNIPIWFPVLSNSTDNADFQNGGSINANSPCIVIPGGDFLFMSSATSLTAYIIKQDFSGYFAVQFAPPAGVTITGLQRNGASIAVDINGNIWLQNNGGGSQSKLLTTFQGTTSPLWNEGIAIPAPLLNSYGLECRSFNPCTLSFEG